MACWEQEQVLKAIRRLDTERGADIFELMAHVDMTSKELAENLDALFKQGDIYQPYPNTVKKL